MKNLLFIVSNIGEKGSAPRNRAESFVPIFKTKGDIVFDGEKSLKKILGISYFNFMYVETATNRLTLKDFISLVLLKRKSRHVIIFLRDVYTEYFTGKFSTLRSKITLLANRLSYFFLCKIADTLVFPTVRMGEFFVSKKPYLKGKFFTDLPPATFKVDKTGFVPDFKRKVGILYLGGIAYKNSGFESFFELSKQYNDRYEFFVLSNDQKITKFLNEEGEFSFHLDFIERDHFIDFFEKNNIGFALHSRPRNDYDDMTFPIKVLDFISMELPFISLPHLPLVQLMGEDYPLFVREIYNSISVVDRYCNSKDYFVIKEYLSKVSMANDVIKRYEKMENLAKCNH